MNVAKSIWASVQGDPVFMRRVNGWLTVFWIVMIPISLWTGWVTSVTYVSALSLWALVSGHWSAWQASRVEVKQAEVEDQKVEEAKKASKDIAKAVVKEEKKTRQKLANRGSKLNGHATKTRQRR